LNATAVAPVKFVPVMVIWSPTRPVVSDSDVIVGAGVPTVYEVGLVAVPPGVVRVIGPVVAPVGTVVVA